MLLEVLKFPDPRLRQKAKAIKSMTSTLQDLAKNMLETMIESRGIGLAAPQVGESVRLIVLDTRPKDEEGKIVLEEMTELEQAIVQPLILFNPQIIKSEDKQTFDEGCLSVPGFYETVQRARVIELKALDINGKELIIKTDGLLSVCLQHEIDHLDGKLFIDRLSLVKSTRIKNKIKKSGYPTDQKEAESKEEFAF